MVQKVAQKRKHHLLITARCHPSIIEHLGFKDLGAGGVACASVELAETAGYGSEVWLDRVHISMENLYLMSDAGFSS